MAVGDRDYGIVVSSSDIFQNSSKIMYRYFKRAADIIVASLLLTLSAPVLLLIAFFIKLDTMGPVIFRQKRYGKDKQPFDCLKFRTMTITDSVGVPTEAFKDADMYITGVGSFLRRSGLDELPQLINVLKGEMSFIGPRPVILAEKKLIAERDKYGANAMLPGIGGWAQSNGRDEIDYKLKARLDGEYAQNFGLGMDVSCLWRTAVAVFTSSGFKEGHIGDTSYKQQVRKRTKKLTLAKRAKLKYEWHKHKITKKTKARKHA